MAVWSEITLSATASAGRADAEYFQPEYLRLEETVEAVGCSRLDALAKVTDGIHGSPDVVEAGGVRYLSAKCVKDNEFALADALQISQAQDSANKRTHLGVDDVLITTVGTIGNAAVVTKDLLPANADRHLGIVRLKADSGVDPYYLSTFLNSRFGRFQTLREATGNVQLNLFIEKIDTLQVPRLPVEGQAAELTRRAYADRKNAEVHFTDAEALFASALGLDGLDLTPRLSYERSYKDAVDAGRLDAEYFNPRAQNLIAALSRDGLAIADIAKLAKRRFQPARGVEFQYIEIGDVGGTGSAESAPVMGEEAPSRATWIVEPGDVITTTVRPIRRLSAVIAEEQGGHVCSSGFAVLKPTEVAPELLLVYLRLPLVCELLDLHTTASMYPAISTADLMEIPISLPDKRTRAKIAAKVKESFAARREARRLLDEAKALVEDAILSAGGGKT